MRGIMRNMSFDFVAIGDIAVNTFIELDSAWARIERGESEERQYLVLPFGEKAPYTHAKDIYSAGNASNAAICAARLGLTSALVSNIGADADGSACLDILRREGVRTHDVARNENARTNHHYVLRVGAERTILVHHEDYPYTMPILPDVPRFMYFSSLGAQSEMLHFTIAEYAREHTDMKLVFQPGTFQIRLGTEELASLYAATYLYISNKEEAQLLLDVKETDIEKLLDGIFALGPKIVLITDGARGAYVKENDMIWYMPVYPDIGVPVDRTGAGDAYSSTFVAALALEQPTPNALMWASINAMSVVQKVGPHEGLLTEDQIVGYLNIAPQSFRPTIIRG